MRYSILTWDNSLSHLQVLIGRGSRTSTGVARTASSVNFWLCSLLCGDNLYLLSAFPHSSLLCIVFVGFLSILQRHSTSQPNFCGYCWSFFMLEPVFSISCWIVAKQPQQVPAIRYLSLCPSKIKRHSRNLLIRRWQWTRKYEHELRDFLQSLGGWPAGKTFVLAELGRNFLGNRSASRSKIRDYDERVSTLS